MLLPEGFALPPLPYLAILVVALIGVGLALRARRPSVTGRHVIGLAPWMAVGSCLHVLYVVDGLPAVLSPFGGTPAVYLTVAAFAGATWLAADASLDPQRVPAALALSGTALLVPVIVATLVVGSADGSLAPFWPAVAFALSIPVTVATWITLTRAVPAAAVTGGVGQLAVFGHVLDAISTAIGIDLLGFGERSPLSRWIMDVAGMLPAAETIGVGWLFVLVKLLVIGAIVVLFAEYVEEEPTEGYLLLGFVAAVGLGPGAHNLLLFTVAG